MKVAASLFAFIVVCALIAACVPKSDFDQLQAENAKLRTELEKRSALPIKVSFRQAMAAPGYVAVLDTTVKSPLSVLLTHKSKSLGTTHRYQLHLDGVTVSELGGLDGAVFEIGDTVTIENTDYSPITVGVRSP